MRLMLGLAAVLAMSAGGASAFSWGSHTHRTAQNRVNNTCRKDPRTGKSVCRRHDPVTISQHKG